MKIACSQKENNVKKLLTLLMLLAWTTVSAHTVLDSESTDHESESEMCKTLVIAACFKATKSSVQQNFIFRPVQKGGTFEVVRDWYMIGNTFKFIPVQQNR